MIRYKKLGYIALNVADIERSSHFYEQMLGLQPNGRGPNGEAFFRVSADHHNLVLYPASRPGLKRVGWQLEDESQFNVLFAQLDKLGIAHVEVSAEECSALGLGRACRMTEPYSGTCFEYYSEMLQCSEAFGPTFAKIQRLGHVVISTPDYTDAVKFATEVLNFRTSDVIDDSVDFLRCFPNPFHHSLAIVNGERKELHHVNFMVSEIDDVGRAVVRFKKHDIPIVYGPGRHPPSGSVFLYFLDPDGMTVEYSYGMEEFPVIDPRKPRLLPAGPDSFDFWGNERDPRMSTVGAIETVDKIDPR